MVMASAGLMLVGACMLIFVVLHIVDRRTDPVERTLSEYALNDVGWLFPVAVFAVAAAAVLLAAGLHQFAPRAPAAALVLLTVFAAAMTVTGIVRTDAMDPRADDVAMSASGGVHASAGFVAIVSLCVAAPMLSSALAGLGASRIGAELIGWLPAFGAAVFAVTVVARGPIERFSGRVSLHGIGERFGLGGFIIWIAYATLTLLTAKTTRM
ncbi:DUF998 domain-containing protein [Actinomadura scrupuli]|uniref:DUF998 domain-containing protein n=1 Tax=Actinomadura scrupuli TaxID=559629 RepID=UPI003D96A9C5